MLCCDRETARSVFDLVDATMRVIGEDIGAPVEMNAVATHPSCTRVHRDMVYALDSLWYEGWNNGFCNVWDDFASCGPDVAPNCFGNAAEKLKYLATRNVAGADLLLDALLDQAGAERSRRSKKRRRT